MPAKKTTTRKTTTKKPATKKPVTKKTQAKKTSIKKPTVIVKENTLKKSDNYCTSGSCKWAWIGMVLLVVNTVLLILLLNKGTNYGTITTALEEFEATRVGGIENHAIMQEIYKLNSYKKDQKRRLETTLDALKQLETEGGDLPLVAPMPGE